MSAIVPHEFETDLRQRAFVILSQIASCRSQVYRWLALGFYPPDAELAQGLNSGKLVEEIALATAWLGQDRQRLAVSLRQLRAGAALALRDLEEDYQRLFGKSSERVSMRESAYRWREVSALCETAGEVAGSLRQHYGQFGVAPLDQQEDVLPVQLEFIAFLCERESAEWALNAAEEARQLRLHERAFLADHLGRWFPEFGRRVSDRAPNAFYAPLIFLSDTWLELEYGPGYLPARSL